MSTELPRLGDTARASDLGYRGGDLRVWHACEDCGAERWVCLCHLRRGGSRRCRSCQQRRNPPPRMLREAHPGWTGGRRVTAQGYVQVRLAPDDPLITMGDKRDARVLEHRIVMARHLGRPLRRDEQVHHVNGDKLDNRIGNLELLSSRDHTQAHHREVERLKARIRELERLLQD